MYYRHNKMHSKMAVLVYSIMISLVYVVVSAADTEIDIPVACAGFDTRYTKETPRCNSRPINYPNDVDDFVDLNKYLSVPTNLNVDNDSSDDNNECEDNCCAVVRDEVPYLIYAESEVKTVVQSAKHIQTIRTVECKQEKNECFKKLRLHENSYTGTCETNYGTTQIYVLNRKGGIEAVSIKFPVSCSCSVSNLRFPDY